MLALRGPGIGRLQAELCFETLANRSELFGLRAHHQVELFPEPRHQGRLARAGRTDNKRMFSLSVESLELRDLPFSGDERKRELTRLIRVSCFHDSLPLSNQFR